MFIKYVLVMIFSASPLLEQRAGILFGIFFAGLNPLWVTLTSYLGSMIPVPFILLLFQIIMEKSQKINGLTRLKKLITGNIRKGSEKILKYKKWGLIMFIALPLPTTGLWVGSMIAAFMGMEFKKAFTYVLIGGMISAVMITGFCYLFPNLIGVPKILFEFRR